MYLWFQLPAATYVQTQLRLAASTSNLQGRRKCQILSGTELALFSTASAASTLVSKSTIIWHLSFQLKNQNPKPLKS
ncbi:hypothetical protein CXF82_20250 [Shewanella sp. GutDb-MelDb]|nr:hypothetical protein CXF82_20250 [Shewanella sp. GutDb-MelDb]